MNKQKYFENNTIISSLIEYMFIVYFAMLIPASVFALETKASFGDSNNPGSFAGLVKKASPSVVNISTVKFIKSRGKTPLPSDPFKDFFDRFFGDRLPKAFKQRSLGTGFIIDKDGHILTNNHVIDQTNEITVQLLDGKEYTATIVGRDPNTDLALIRIASKQSFVPMTLGDSDRVEVGDWVIAIGNPFGLGNTVSAGIVSAKYRQIGEGPYDNFIQTDTPINPGNSGGPLLDMQGDVIGINTAIFSQGGGSIGIGFAIPINMVLDLLPQLRKGRVIRGTLGIMIQKITPELKEKLKLEDDKGALVSDVISGGPSEIAGIKRGDVVVTFDGMDIKESGKLPYIVSSTPVGKVVAVEVIRQGEKRYFRVKIDELKEEIFPLVEREESQQVLGMTVTGIRPDIAEEFGLPEKNGVIVLEVEDDSPSAESGLMSGDIIIEVDQVRVKELDAFSKKLTGYKKGETILFLVNRGGITIYLTLKVMAADQ